MFDIGTMPTLVPPLEEQHQIVSHIEAETRELNTAIARIQREIELIREYRTRLVCDVVTGQFDVREAAALLPDEEPALQVLAPALDAEPLDLIDSDDSDDSIMTPKVIKTEADYEAALARIETIFAARPGTPDGDELELLSLLVERYEEAQFPVALPDPLTAIRFRMEQAGLKQKDLVPFIGSQSKVSEVLAGKRPLSLSMMRGLASGLGIPAEVLLQQPGAQLEAQAPDWADVQFPLGEMLKRGWFEGFHGTLSQAKTQSEELLRAFFAPLGQPAATWNCGLNRQHVRSQSQMNACALTVWRVRVATLALREPLPAYRPGTVTPAFLRQLVRLSYFEEGPKLAKEFLGKNGIPLIIEEHLPQTFLDGAALQLPNGAPMVALTLRHDRLDNFWFTLLHELAHVALHLDRDGVDAFFDDLNEDSTEECEREADAMAMEALIPAEEWQSAALGSDPPARAVRALAEKLCISPAIPAGRIRHHTRNYRVLPELIGSGKVRCLFAAMHH